MNLQHYAERPKVTKQTPITLEQQAKKIAEENVDLILKDVPKDSIEYINAIEFIYGDVLEVTQELTSQITLLRQELEAKDKKIKNLERVLLADDDTLQNQIQAMKPVVRAAVAYAESSFNLMDLLVAVKTFLASPLANELLEGE